MNIDFAPLSKSHFSLLLKWLEAPHIKQWWDKDITWTQDLIKQKYESYTKGYSATIKKPIHAFIIIFNKIQLNLPISNFVNDTVPIGYVQYYNRHNFPFDSKPVIEVLKFCSGLDYYIGELEFTGQGIGSAALNIFIEKYIFPKYQHVIVDPENANTIAIAAYKKAGFVVSAKTQKTTWMIKKRVNHNFCVSC